MMDGEYRMGISTPSIPTEEAPMPAPRAIPWIPIAWFALLLIVCYAPILQRLVNQWISDEDMGHGFFVPAVAGYVAWQRRQELLAAPAKPSVWGLALILFAAFQMILATLGAELFLARTAFIESLVGAILFLRGWQAIKILGFPLFLLVFMVPIPSILYSRITFPLQIFASRVAEFSLSLIGIPVLRDGNVLELASQKLSVVEACSGIRSLLSLTFLSLIYAYFFDSKVWMRAFMLCATIPIAIIANASRVTITGILSEINKEYASGVYHSLSGWVVFMVAFVLMVLVHQITNRIYGWKYGKQ
jgi:exosortase